MKALTMSEEDEKLPAFWQRAIAPRSQIMLISVRKRAGWNVVVPLPMFFIEDLAVAIVSVLQALLAIRPGLKRRLADRLPPPLQEWDIPSLISTLREIVREMRSCGSWTLLEIDDPGEGVEIKIRLI